MVKAVIFDCFGVLYPDASGMFFERHKDLFDGDSTFLDKLNREIDLGKITRAEFFAGLENQTGMSSDEIQTEVDEALVVDQKLVEVIKKLKTKYKTGLLSNAGREEIEIIYRDGINVLFDSITVSYETGTVKPSSEIFLTCTQRLGVKPKECLFIDDNLVNTEAAGKFGMKTIKYSDPLVFNEELESLFSEII